jgi:acetyltransferase-like isoleucine patch superfamily enzyme
MGSLVAKARTIVPVLGSWKARRSGVVVGRSASLSNRGRYTLGRNARVVMGDAVWLGRQFDIHAEEGAEILIGNRAYLGDQVRLHAMPGARIVIEEDCWFNHDVEITACVEIRIGKHTRFGPYCYLIDHDHGMARDRLIKLQDYQSKPIVIGEDAWLGVGATVLRGGCVGEGAVVAARAVVTASIPPYEIWGGIPARKLGERP